MEVGTPFAAPNLQNMTSWTKKSKRNFFSRGLTWEYPKCQISFLGVDATYVKPCGVQNAKLILGL